MAVTVNDNGLIHKIKPGVAGANAGCLLPGLANLHSHAHQRAMAGLSEHAQGQNDSFWTWRAQMYRLLESLQPHHLHAIASQLYMEMLKAGYTRVAEFQYLHHQTNGQPYANVAEMSLQTLTAARELGLGITSLPVLYQFGGFGGRPPSRQQARFTNDTDQFLSIFAALDHETRGDVNANIGIAAHSLRAVAKESLNEVLNGLPSASHRPIHIHIAEQLKEVTDCLAWSGARPVDYLYDNFEVDQRWCLVHATHLSDTETLRVAKSKAVVGLCPTTEANLGDGFFNAGRFIDAGGQFGIGSDSHVSISPVEELRWLEYGQRLIHQSRNQLCANNTRSTGRNLFDLAVAGGARACAHNAGAIEIGKRADFLVLDTDHPLLHARENDEILDSWIFSGNQNTVRDVFVGGEQVISGGRHVREEAVAHRYKSVLNELRANQ